MFSKFFTFSLNAFVALVFTAISFGQAVIFEDDFDSYTAGLQLACQNPIDWTTWSNDPCGSEDANVSALYANSGSNSVVIVQNNNLIKHHGQLTSGRWYISFQMYIPAGKAGYFNSMSGFTPSPFQWAHEVYFDVGGGGRLMGVPGAPIAFSWTENTWQLVQLVVALVADEGQFWFNGEKIYFWEWTQGGSVNLQLDANDFFGVTADDEMYIDDFMFDSSMFVGTNSIEGKIFHDINGNCPQVPGEGLPGWTIRLMPGPLFAITNTDGKYKFPSLGAGTYTIAEDLKSFWGQTCPDAPGTYTVTLTSGETITGKDFANHIVDFVQDLAVSAVTYFPFPLQTACCGQEMTYQISYSNLGSVEVSGATIEVDLSTHALYLETTLSNPPYLSLTLIPPDKLVYELPSPLLPGASGTIHVRVRLTCDPLDPDPPMIVTHVRIEPFDNLQQNNIINAMDQVSCSFDPNDMAVSPPGCGVEGYITKDDVLTYTIRFQNLGSGPAFQVVIRNVLNINLDIGTVTNLGSSHPNVFEVNGNELVWTFPGIELPPASIDEPGSHGYIKFRVNQMPDNLNGTVIENLAAIYFDLNDPVLTNTTVNTITSNPFPVASFTITASLQCTYNFTYTGGTIGASFLWDFGSGALPQTSTDQNPANVTYTQSGLKVITLQVKLGSCVTEPAVETLTMLDNIPPIITVSAPIDLWPPNHEYQTINITDFVLSVADACTGEINIDEVVITSVSSDEEEDAPGGGDGRTIDDIVLAGDCKSVQLRKERAGNGNGRVYTITVGVSDGFGNIVESTYKVTVPHNNGSNAIDDGVAYSVEGCEVNIPLAKIIDNDEKQEIILPKDFKLYQNYPNPFNPTTTIHYELPLEGFVTLKVFDVLGKEVKTLIEGYRTEGRYEVEFDATNLPSGIYFYKLQAGSFVETKKMILLR